MGERERDAVKERKVEKQKEVNREVGRADAIKHG